LLLFPQFLQVKKFSIVKKAKKLCIHLQGKIIPLIWVFLQFAQGITEFSWHAVKVYSSKVTMENSRPTQPLTVL
ncbi:MAG: hypothetical protein IJ974_02580, partial [Phascolarctobacterium sp.]|nr:hypothetical protein [Phascolarctobacterium sp.]